jgi:hypothetical protein
LAVREDDEEPEPLDDEGMLLEGGDIVAMAVKVGSVLSATTFGCAASHLQRDRRIAN